MKQTCERLIGAGDFHQSIIGTGYPAEFNLATLSIRMNGNARVGLQDNIFLSKGVMAKSNAALVEKIVRIARELGRDMATTDEAMNILSLKGRDKVGY